MGRAQDPIIKPTTSIDPTIQVVRLPAPTSVSARQLPDGRIEVRWSAVAGAARYQVTRSVPPEPAQVLPVTPTEPIFVDAAIQVGRTYYYVIAAYNTDNSVGLKAGSAPVTAVIPLGGTSTAPTTTSVFSTTELTAHFIPPNHVHLTWSPSSVFTGAVSNVTVQRVLRSTTGTQAFNVARVPLSAAAFDDSFDPRGAIEVYYRLLADGQTSPVATSNVVRVTTDTGTGSGTDPSAGGTSTTTTTTAAASVGSTTFTVSAPLSLKVGGVASAAGSGGAGARWISMNETVATVDAAGSVTARAAGSTQVVSLAGGADGSLRVASVPVTVTP